MHFQAPSHKSVLIFKWVDEVDLKSALGHDGPKRIFVWELGSGGHQLFGDK